MFRQVLRCKDCNILVHKRCAKDIGSNCAGEVPSLNRVDSGEWSECGGGGVRDERMEWEGERGARRKWCYLSIYECSEEHERERSTLLFSL